MASLTKVLVTGGAGFIGSHIADGLFNRTGDVIAIDNLSSGRIENLHEATRRTGFKFVAGDLKKFPNLPEVLNGVSLVYHFAANPEVRVGAVEPSVHFEENLLTTFNLLEAMRASGEAKTIVFASTSTVYGQPTQLPTPEDYGPMLPISTYGASKLGCESLISAYAYTHGMRGLILRLGNCVGSRSRHGVVSDFIQKLRTNPNELEILGDGSQIKSYVHVTDCVNAILLSAESFLRSDKRVEVYNLSSPDQVSVKRIAEIVVEELGLRGVKMKFTGGVDGGRGWLGDVKIMHLSVAKLMKLGWRPKLNSEEAIRAAAKELVAETT
ncbi:MAG: NAD-dependent epimerase/dehydratase family protein [Candidatus Bathyarchaeia archaeon]